MIKEIQVQGSIATTHHDFVITQLGMDIIISSGSYHSGNVLRAESSEETIITINSPEVEVQLEIWVCAIDGSAQFELYESGDTLAELSYSIDRLAWFTVPAGATTLDGVEINVIKINDGGSA